MKILVALTCLCCSLAAFGHEYFFSFAEMEYNASTKRFEVFIQTSVHDTETALKQAGVAVKDLEMQSKEPEIKAGLEVWINRGFYLLHRNNRIAFKMIGLEVLPNGQLYVYLESEPEEIENEFTVNFPLLMDLFPKQQNKLTFLYKSNKQTAVFLPNKTAETLKLER